MFISPRCGVYLDCIAPHCTALHRIYRNVQSLVEQGQKGELTMQPGKSMMESLESSINKVNELT